MNTKSIINSLNLTGGEILTLEKARDRMEFEALPVMVLEQQKITLCPCFGAYVHQCDPDCGVNVCDCKGPVAYVDQDHCRPYTDCPDNHCRPVQ